MQGIASYQTKSKVVRCPVTGGGGDPPSNSYSVLTGALTPRHFDRPRQLTGVTPRQFDKQDRGRYHGYEECLTTSATQI